MTANSNLSRLMGVVCAALMLCLPALWNGLPFFYPDTPTYLRGAQMTAQGIASRLGLRTDTAASPVTQAPAGDASAAPASRGLTSLEDRIVLAGRSVYYGALLYAAQAAGSLWLAVIAQALCVAAVLHLLLVKLWRVTSGAFLGTTAVLSLATPLAVYTGLLMPDVFAGLATLAFAALSIYWRQLTRMERGLLAGVLLFGLLSHASHVAVAAVLLAGVLAMRLWNARWQGVSGPACTLAGLCIVIAIAAEWAFAAGVTHALGVPPLRLPYPTARLIEMGPGTQLLAQRCPEAGYAVCAYRANYPTAWDAFLFSTDPARGTFALADAATKRRIVDEQWHFVRDVIVHDPMGVLRGWWVDLGRQLVSFRVDVWSFGARQLAMFAGRVPPQTYAALQASRGLDSPGYNLAMSAATYGSAGIAVLLGVWWVWRRHAGAIARMPQRLEQVAGIAIAGVAVNALVCVTAASSLDRFQSRVIWLIPFFALTVLALAWTRRFTHAPRPRGSTLKPATGTGMEGAAS